MKFQQKHFIKKGQIGPTITWFVAFIVIFFITSMFVLGASSLAGQRFSSNLLGNLQGSAVSIDNRWVFQKQSEILFLKLLNRPIEIGGEKILVRDLIYRIESGNRKQTTLEKGTLTQEIIFLLDKQRITDKCYFLRTDTQNIYLDNLAKLQNIERLFEEDEGPVYETRSPPPGYIKTAIDDFGYSHEIVPDKKEEIVNLFIENLDTDYTFFYGDKKIKLKFYAGPCSIL